MISGAAARRTLRRRLQACRVLARQQRDFDNLRVVPRLSADLDLPATAFFGLLPAGMAEPAKNYLRQRLFYIAWEAGAFADAARVLCGETGPFVLPLPTQWRSIFAENGQASHPLWSRLRFALVLVRHLRDGFRRFGHYVKGARAGGRVDAPYAVLLGLAPTQTPAPQTPDGRYFDACNWYWQSTIRPASVQRVWAQSHGGGRGEAPPWLEIVTGDPFPALEGRGRRLAFLGDALRLCVGAALLTLVGRWWAALLLRQIIDYSYVRRLPSDRLAVDYLFHMGFALERPLWTYYVERQGSKVTLVSYSHSVNEFQKGLPDQRQINPHFLFWSWSRYTVFHAFQAEAYRQQNIVGEFLLADDVSLTDDGLPLPVVDGPMVAVFDIPPRRPSVSGRVGAPRPYQTDDIVLRFLNDVFSAIREAGAVPLYKPKGGLVKGRGGRTPARHKGGLYEVLIDQFDCMLVGPNAPAHRLCLGSAAVISMPFTTTGAIGVACDRPSVYYDPTGTLAGFREFASGVPLIVDRPALVAWLRGVIAENCAKSKESN